MKFSKWFINKNKSVIEEKLFKLFNSVGFLEEIIKEQEEIDDLDEPVEIPDPFTGGEDAAPINTDSKISNIERRRRRELDRKEAIKRKRIEKSKKILSRLQGQGAVDSPDELLKDAKDKMLLLRYKGMYERKKRIDELIKLTEKEENAYQNIKRIFDLLVELDYLRPPGVRGGPRGGDQIQTIESERLNKAIENAKKESGNDDYPDYLEQFLSTASLERFEEEAKKALVKVFDYPVEIPYPAELDGQGRNAVDKILETLGRRRVTSFSIAQKDRKNLLKAKDWNWPWLTNSENANPQEIKDNISRRLHSAEGSKKTDNRKRKEKTIGSASPTAEKGMDPVALVRSKEKAPQMTVAQMDRLERVEKINQAIKNSFNKLHRSNSNAFEIVSEFLGLNHDSMGNIEIPEDISPLYKQIQTGQSTKPDTDELSRKLSQKIGYRGEVNKDRLGKIIRDSLKIIRRELTSELANLDLGWRGAARGTLGTLGAQSEVTFYDWLIING